jgi:ribosomal RNA-processing protein 8
MSLRYYQQEAKDEIIKELSINSKCLVKMFCGSGKSLIMKNIVEHYNENLSVFVFPSLSLLEQFHSDYFRNSTNVLMISSAVGSTTNNISIIEFIENKNKKIICVTYQSFELLLKNLQNNKIDVCCFDEAHHAVGNVYQTLIFNDDNLITKQIFFTATPKNTNGIVMYDKNDTSKSMCGKLVYDYSYYRGMNEGYLNPFDIEVGLFTENTNKSIYESIARSILNTGNNRVLTFHATVNSDANSSTKNFVNEKLFKESFDFIVNTEFESKKGFYKKISMIGLDATVSMKNRKKILSKFKKNIININDNDITILCSCETIGEGVDTNDANMCVFVDPKSSVVKIIQNIGRIVRKQYGINKPKSTVLIPCWVDKFKYENCITKEERDKVIREDMSKDGNYIGVLNVLSALHQEQEDLFDECDYFETEIETSFSNCVDKNVGVKNGDKKDTEEQIETNDKYKRPKMLFQCNSDLKVLWSIKELENVEYCIKSCLLECEFVNVWGGNFVKLNEFIDENEKTPSCDSIDKHEKFLATWLEHQNHNYKNRTKGMLHDDQYNIWSGFLEVYAEYFDVWNSNFNKLKAFLNENKELPLSGSTNEYEKSLASWLSNQTYDYKNTTMSNEEHYTIWSNFLWEYADYFDVWISNFNKLKAFLNENKKFPLSVSTNEYEKTLALWARHQNQNYKNRTHRMNDDIPYNAWTLFCDTHVKNNQIKPVKTMELVKPSRPKKNFEYTVKKTTDTPEIKKIRIKSQMEVLHQRYKTLSSTNLNKEFSDNSNLWNEYHDLSEKNEESFPKEGIPRNRIINELEKLKARRTKTVVDMGCGRAQISKHFTDKNDTRFQFINYDHVSSNESVISCDISNTPLENDSVEIVILSLAMWGSNCKSYITEAHRILESNGLLYIIEATKRWSEEDENHNLIQGEEGGKLKNVLIENHFQVSESKIEKFSLFVCNKRQII